MGAPPILAPQVDATLSLFGGMDTEISPSDCPEGLSPDNQDMIYLPGETQSRYGLRRLFANPFSNGVSVLYEKSYVQPNGNPLTLILTSDGKIWAEDITNSPGTYNQIGSTVPGLYAQSVTAFGREYIAISDLLHGQGVPLQFDGTNLDRVTMDGPGSPPTIRDLNLVLNAGATAPVNPSTITAIAETGNDVLVTTAAPHGLTAGQIVFVVATGVDGYNGQQMVTTVPSPTTFTFTLVVTGLGAAATGSIFTAISVDGIVGTLGVGDAFQLNGVVTTSGNPFDNGVGGNPTYWKVATLVGSKITFLPIGAGSALLTATGLTSAVGTVNYGGQSTAGAHKCVVMFLTRQGYLTRPSPPVTFTSLGNSRWTTGSLPIGPSNVVARVLGFTGAGGDNYFIIPATITIPATVQGMADIVIQSTIVPDNSSTSATISFSDNSLFAGVPIDVVGNNLFDQKVLGPVLGFFAFASRLMAWGDYNKIENFLNMGFCGGDAVTTVPLGWTYSFDGFGVLVNGGPWAAGMSYRITGNGTATTKGLITQPAYHDYLGNPILSPSTQYLLRIWAKASAANLAGNLIVDFYSPVTGVIASATIPANTISTTGGFLQVNFSAMTPAQIRSDTLLRVYGSNLSNGGTVTISEVEIVFSVNPFRPLSSVSYVIDPEGFAQTTGNLGPTDDDSPIRCFSRQRNTALLKTAEGTHVIQDNTSEPYQWSVNALSHSVGAVSLRAGDPGKFGTGDAAEDWDLSASKNGLYLFSGAEFWKVSQEMSKGAGLTTALTWDDINWAAEQTIWVKNDPGSRRAYIGVPVNGAPSPNLIFVLDYREMDTAAQIASATPIHITLAGKMKSSDLTRKWSRWNIKANCGEVLVRPGNQRTFFVGGGNGLAPGQGAAFGNIYSLDPLKLTDDDYGAISPYYTTYAFIDHDQEQGFQLGSTRHFYKHISGFISGVGLVTITPLVNSLFNALPATSPRLLRGDTDISNPQAGDLEWTVGIRGQRVFFKIQVQPLPGTTAVQMKLQKLIVQMTKDPVALFRGSGV